MYHCSSQPITLTLSTGQQMVSWTFLEPLCPGSRSFSCHRNPLLHSHLCLCLYLAFSWSLWSLTCKVTFLQKQSREDWGGKRKEKKRRLKQFSGQWQKELTQSLGPPSFQQWTRRRKKSTYRLGVGTYPAWPLMKKSWGNQSHVQMSRFSTASFNLKNSCTFSPLCHRISTGKIILHVAFHQEISCLSLGFGENIIILSLWLMKDWLKCREVITRHQV